MLAFIFLYIDFFMPRETKKGLVLLGIGIYATSILVFKVVLAVIHHLKWMLTERCCRSIPGEKMNRNVKLKEFWQQSYREFYTASKLKAEKS